MAHVPLVFQSVDTLPVSGEYWYNLVKIGGSCQQLSLR